MKDRDVEQLGNHLDNKKIALLISDGIARYKTYGLIRHFRRYGAEIDVFLTPTVYKKVDLEAIEYSSLSKPIVELTADIEHLNKYDAYLLAPATLNTIGKVANGIADNAVTTTLATALGRLEKGETKVLISPTMHMDLERNPFYRENMEKLKSKGVKIIEPVYKNNKANFPESEYIVVQTIREMSNSGLRNKNILVTAGPTPGWIDNVRYITNKFRGRTGIEIAKEAYMRGANVRLILGPGGVEPPRYISTIHIRDFYEYYSKVLDVIENDDIDIGIFSAAVADYIPSEVKEGKIPSQGALKSIPLKETPKVIKEVRKRFPDLFMVTFKYEEGVSREELENIARKRMRDGYQLVIANRGEDMVEEDVHHSIIVDESGVIAEPKTKIENARLLLDILEKKIYAI